MSKVSCNADWIDVTRRLPTDEQDVLVKLSTGAHAVAMYSSIVGFIPKTDGYVISSDDDDHQEPPFSGHIVAWKSID